MRRRAFKWNHEVFLFYHEGNICVLNPWSIFTVHVSNLNRQKQTKQVTELKENGTSKSPVVTMDFL